eukprot:7199043-Prymnesium_polylepis.1
MTTRGALAVRDRVVAQEGVVARVGVVARRLAATRGAAARQATATSLPPGGNARSSPDPRTSEVASTRAQLLRRGSGQSPE